MHKALVGSMQLRDICGGKISYRVPFLLCLNLHMTLSHQATAKKADPEKLQNWIREDYGPDFY